jgi:hypothetical protein
LVDDLNNDNTDPVFIGDTSVNILLYADDIVLLLQSKEGLQNSLDILHDFCYTWKLKVNTDKSKIMVNVESTPQTSLPYVRIGVTKESNNFSRSLHGLLRPIVFLILKSISFPYPS